ELHQGGRKLGLERLLHVTEEHWNHRHRRFERRLDFLTEDIVVLVNASGTIRESTGPVFAHEHDHHDTSLEGLLNHASEPLTWLDGAKVQEDSYVEHSPQLISYRRAPHVPLQVGRRLHESRIVGAKPYHT